MNPKLFSAFGVLMSATLAVLLGGCGQDPARGAEQVYSWPRWGGPDGNWVSRETDWNPKALAGSPHILWEQNIGMGYSDVAIKTNRVYAFGYSPAKNNVSCLDADTGQRIWLYSVENWNEPLSTPAVDSGSVFVLTKDGVLQCLNTKNGRLRWQKDLGSEYGAQKPSYGFAGSPVVEGDLLVLNVNTSGLALKKGTGALVWRSEAPPISVVEKLANDTGTTYMTPVIYSEDGIRCALIYSWIGLISVNVSTGEIRWKHEWDNYGVTKAPDPVLTGGRILIANDHRADYYNRFSTFLSIELGNPAVLWKSADLYCDASTPVILDGYIYGIYGGAFSISLYASLRCLELDTGTLRWEYHPQGKPVKQWISFCAADGKLIVLYEEGRLAIIDASPAGYREISAYALPLAGKKKMQYCTPPVLCNGRIYCRNFGGELTCIDVSR